MLGENEQRWRELCERAAKETDPDRLIELVREINRLLEAKKQRLRRAAPGGRPDKPE
jgi:hypothetical protein